MSFRSFVIFLSVIACSSLAQAQDASKVRTNSFPLAASNGAKFEPLPLEGVVAVEKDGVMRVVSSNARFQFVGEVIDKWSGKSLQNLADVSRAFNYADFSEIKFQFDLLEPYTLGTGSKIVTIFVDPLCPHCGRVFKELPRDSDIYTFKIIPVALLGQDSILAVKNLECAVDQNAALQALLTNQYDHLVQKPKGCKPDLVTKRLVVTQILGLGGVPYIIRHDGLIGRGYPPMGFINWLTEG